ncbi:HipA domain-containing protein [Flavihumibacter sp. UBA7668]|uniref:HipA domain-containing protein n=1 Tax=Flavihumibacter sp. UBA7668 TaxID=1946542 RepID=UPI0025C11180|nr:HipA domain-containing protein [Flavihumibacter sp. UBA7668]
MTKNQKPGHAFNKFAMGNLRVEKSINNSGKLANKASIPLLKERDYYVKDYTLDGDAPKQFIKAYFYEKNSTTRKCSRRSWPGFIAKTAEKWYPHESVTEFMMNRVGEELGLHMNEIRLVRANGQIRFLSRYFLKEDEKLIHGAEICGEHLGDMIMAREIAIDKTSARDLFTFEFIRDAIRSVYPNCFEELLKELVKMIVFDGLTGNNDRHFYNWGVIDTKKKTTKLPTFAPLYDSARGMLWNMSDLNIKDNLNSYLKYIQLENPKFGNKVVNYIEEASPRISIESNNKANHFELIDFIRRFNADYDEIVRDLTSEKNEYKVLNMLRGEFYPMFTTERQELLSIIVRKRFQKIRN